MKRTVIFTVLAAALYFQSGVVPAQAQGYNWGSWKQDPCFSGLQFRARYDSFNDRSNKHLWAIQYRNNYQRNVAFSYVIKGTRDEISQYVRETGGQYRTELKPGQEDNALWVQTSNQSEILEVAGHARLLDQNEIDVSVPFIGCDTNGNRGQIDYICRNEPKTSPFCANYVHPPPAALTLGFKTGTKTGAGSATSASAKDCLDAYEYFSKHRKSDDPVAVKQAIDAADAFRSRCKLTPEQQTSVNEAITSTRNRLERVQNNQRSSPSGGADMFTDTEAVKKNNISVLRLKIVDFFKSHVFQGTLTTPDFDGGTTHHTYSNLRVSYDPNDVFFIVTMRVRLDSWYDKDMRGEITFDSTIGRGWGDDPSNLKKMIPMDSWPPGHRVCLGKEHIGGLHIGDGNISECIPFDFEQNRGSYEEFMGLIKSFESVANESTEASKTKDSSDEDANPPKLQPTTVADYEKKVAAEAKAAGKRLQPSSPTPTKKLPPLTPKQRAAQDTQARQELSDLIQKDFDEKKAELAEEEKRAEALVAAERKRTEEQRSRVAEEAEKRSQRAVLQRRINEGKAYGDIDAEFTFDFPESISSVWTFTYYTLEKRYHYTRPEFNYLSADSFQLPGNQNCKQYVEARRDWLVDYGRRRQDLRKTVQMNTFAGELSGFVIISTQTEFGKNYYAREYYFEGKNGRAYSLGMRSDGTGSAKEWILRWGDEVAKTFRIK